MIPDDDIRIDPEFQGLIPPLRPDERERLETSIRAEGIRDAIIVWRQERVVLDGHNRIGIARRLNIPHHERIQFRDFDTRDDAKRWVLENQLGRRNLSDIDRIAIASKLERLISVQAKSRMLAGRADPTQKSAEGDTRVQAAKLAGVGHQKYTEGKRVLAEGSPELIAAVRSGEVSVHRAAEIIKHPAVDIAQVPDPTPTSPETSEEPDSEARLSEEVPTDDEIQELMLAAEEALRSFRETWRALRRAALTRCKSPNACALAREVERKIVDPTFGITRSGRVLAHSLEFGRARR